MCSKTNKKKLKQTRIQSSSLFSMVRITNSKNSIMGTHYASRKLRITLFSDRYTPSGLCHRPGSRLQSSHQIFNGNLHLSKGHDLPWRILQHVNRTYDVTQNNRHMIGPEVSSSVIKNMYNFERFYNGFYPSPTGTYSFKKHFPGRA